MNNTITGLATTLAAGVNDVQQKIVETQVQLAAGKRTLNPAENGVVTRLTAQVLGYKSVEKNIVDAQSVIDVGQVALQSIANIMVQMRGLAVQSSSVGFASTDRDSLNTTFESLAKQIGDIAASAGVNGNNLINTSNGLTVTTGIDGTTASQTTVQAANVTAMATIINNLRINGGMTGTNTTTTTGTSTAYQVDTIALSNTSPASELIAGDSITISGLVYTCPSGSTADAATVATAFAAFITNGNGTPAARFTTTDGTLLADKAAALQAQYATATAASGTLTLTSASFGPQSPPSLLVDTRYTAIANCQIATTSLSNQVASVSAAQSSLSAATTGLKAQLETATALGTGVQKTIDSIANVDATELQAFLQNLNTQQSVDYYLVSQMNQASAAILSIFR